MAAACSGLIARIGLSRRDGAIIGVRTNGMWMLVNVMWSDSVSDATTPANASSAALDGRYELYLGLRACTPALETLTTCPNRRSRQCGSSASTIRTAPK